LTKHRRDEDSFAEQELVVDVLVTGEVIGQGPQDRFPARGRFVNKIENLVGQTLA
jgi:hypothetical protein